MEVSHAGTGKKKILFFRFGRKEKPKLLSHTPSHVSTGAEGLPHGRNGEQPEHGSLSLSESLSKVTFSFALGVDLKFHG